MNAACTVRVVLDAHSRPAHTIHQNEVSPRDHFTVVCSVTWPLNGSEAAGDLVLIRTSLLLLGKSRNKSLDKRKVMMGARSMCS